ncbi:hypothetical protein JCM11251_006333 [Rhodosporidiobolus azoricus]
MSSSPPGHTNHSVPPYPLAPASHTPPSGTHPTSPTPPLVQGDVNGTRPVDGTRGGASAGGGMRHGRWNWYRRRPEQAEMRLVVKNHFIAMIGEFVGTATFLFFALGGTNVANIPDTSVTGSAGEVAAPNTSNLLFIALSFGFSLAVSVWVFFRISGGLFNPAVSLGMLLIGALTPVRAALLVVSQLLGAIVGAALISALTPGPLYALTTLRPGMSISRGCFLEMFATWLLLLAILFLAAEKTKATFLAPIGIGLALFVAELATVLYTGGSLNPARSFGPAVVMGDFPGYHWIYWVGPCLGAAFAAAFYRFLKWMEYETVMNVRKGEADDSEAQIDLPAPRTELVDDEEAQRRGERKEAKRAGKTVDTGPTMRGTQGPGLGDLLTDTRDASSTAYDLSPSSATTARFDRIEHMLAQLVSSSHDGQGQMAPLTASTSGSGSGSGSGGYRPSMEGTLVEEQEEEGGRDSAHPGGWKAGEGGGRKA